MFVLTSSEVLRPQRLEISTSKFKLVKNTNASATLISLFACNLSHSQVLRIRMQTAYEGYGINLLNAESITIIVYDDQLSSTDAKQVGTCFCNDTMHVSTVDILHNYRRRPM